MIQKVAYLAPKASYGWRCGVDIFGISAMETHGLPCERNEDIVEVVREGKAGYGVVPIENGIQGPVFPVLTELLESHQNSQPVYAVCERVVLVQHFLIGVPGAEITAIQTVKSHEQALGQCRKHIRAGGYRAVPTNSTSGAVEEIMAAGDIAIAAIASEVAAKRFEA